MQPAAMIAEIGAAGALTSRPMAAGRKGVQVAGGGAQLPGVRRIDHTWIPLADGTRLSARIWLPDGAEQQPLPALLEAIPYRKDDVTSIADAGRHGYSPSTATSRCGSTSAAAATPRGCWPTSTCSRSRTTWSR